MTDANLGMDRPKPWAREPVEITSVSNPVDDMQREIAELRDRVNRAEVDAVWYHQVNVVLLERAEVAEANVVTLRTRMRDAEAEQDKLIAQRDEAECARYGEQCRADVAQADRERMRAALDRVTDCQVCIACVAIAGAALYGVPIPAPECPTCNGDEYVQPCPRCGGGTIPAPSSSDGAQPKESVHESHRASAPVLPVRPSPGESPEGLRAVLSPGASPDGPGYRAAAESRDDGGSPEAPGGEGRGGASQHRQVAATGNPAGAGEEGVVCDECEGSGSVLNTLMYPECKTTCLECDGTGRVGGKA